MILFGLNIFWILGLLLGARFFYRVFWRPYFGVKFYLGQNNSAGYYSFSIKFFIDRLKDILERADYFYYFKTVIHKNPEAKFVVSNWGADPYVMLHDPALIKGFLTNPKNYAKHESTIGLFNDLVKSSIVFTENQQWKRSRKILSSGFHHEFLKNVVDTVINTSETKLEDLKKVKNVDVVKLFCSITGNITGRFFFGRNLDNYKIDNIPLTEAITEVANEILLQASSPVGMILGINFIRLQLFKSHRTLMRRIRGLREKTQEIINETRTSLSKENNLLRLLIDMTDSENAKYTNEELIEEFLGIFLAGTDTTGHTVAIATYFISKNPQIYEKLRKEALEIFSKPVDYDTLSKMEYTTAFIKECLRYFGPAGGLFNRVALVDHNIEGLRIRKGDLVTVNINPLHFDPKYYSQPFEFIPERFLPNSGIFPDDKWKSDPFAYVPFSAGPRNCIGQHLAMVEAKIMIAEMVMKYQIKYPDNYKLRMGYKFTYDAWDMLAPEFIPV